MNGDIRIDATVLRNLLKHRFGRFILVGVLNSLVGYGLFAGFLYLGIQYAFALLLATILGVAFNFKSIGILVFGSHDDRLLMRFVASYAVVYLVNSFGIMALASIGCSPYAGGAILIIPMAVLAFILNKKFVFHHG